MIKSNIEVFDAFYRVYLFGSVIDSDCYHDIDLLVIYETCPSKNETSLLIEQLSDLLNCPIDATFLSIDEERKLQFSNKIKEKCLQIK